MLASLSAGLTGSNAAARAEPEPNEPNWIVIEIGRENKSKCRLCIADDEDGYLEEEIMGFVKDLLGIIGFWGIANELGFFLLGFGSE